MTKKDKASTDNKEGVVFFSKSGSPKNFKETIKMVLNLVVNLFG